LFDTWASWHVQNGTGFHDLNELGGWASMAMVEQYAHMSYQRAANVAGNIDGILWQKSGGVGDVPESPTSRNPALLLVAWGGIEPPTQGFSVLCSTN
jgi:hypothetical protein